MRILSLVVCLTVALGAPSAFGTLLELELKPLEPMPVHEFTTREIVDQLAAKHYVTTILDDDLSSQVFDSYLENLDPQKSYFLQSDIDSFEVFRYKIDNALRKGDLTPAYTVWNIYHKRLITRFQKLITSLEQGIDSLDFTAEESLDLDRSDDAWAKNEVELDLWWRKRTKDAVLNLKLTDKETDKIQELLIKRYQNRLNLTLQTKSEDVYQLYINSFTGTYDPHTQYYSPRSAENFNINMSLSLEGIGAVLQQEEEFTKVVSLVPAGPADKAGQLKPSDKIIGVGQGEGEIEDVIGWRLSDVVQLIRGKKNTVVRLDIIPAGSEASDSKIIHITRNTVKLEEQAAKSKLIELEHFGQPYKIGVIDVPAFYSDFQAMQAGDKNYRSTTRDVRKLIEDLKVAEVDGIIIDLRSNGGGSLGEAQDMTGLFIDRGPVVQIRNKSNKVSIGYDKDYKTLYSGPLAVLVNRLSASASEIFAGAIQDYQRGVIIGNQTFGKGTVQTIVPLTRGQLKLTQMKFYRISGASNQHRGIIPDIKYPENVDPEAIGESSLDNPLPWDTISATLYRTKSRTTDYLPDLRKLHETRIKTNPEFIYEQEAIAYRRELSDAESRSLNEQTRIKQKNDAEAFLLALENRKRQALGQDTLASLDELDAETLLLADAAEAGVPVAAAESAASESDALIGNELAGNTAPAATIDTPAATTAAVTDKYVSTPDKEEQSEKPYDPDAFITESANILLDLMTLQNLSKPGTQPATAKR